MAEERRLRGGKRENNQAVIHKRGFITETRENPTAKTAVDAAARALFRTTASEPAGTRKPDPGSGSGRKSGDGK